MTIKTEILEWHMDPQDVPDSDDKTVMVWLDDGGRRDAYWPDDGLGWACAWSHTRIPGVIGWADPKGPTT